MDSAVLDGAKHPCEKGRDVCPCWDGQGCCLTFPGADKEAGR